LFREGISTNVGEGLAGDAMQCNAMQAARAIKVLKTEQAVSGKKEGGGGGGGGYLLLKKFLRFFLLKLDCVRAGRSHGSLSERKKIVQLTRTKVDKTKHKSGQNETQK
jgi:hypothetical protein